MTFVARDWVITRRRLDYELPRSTYMGVLDEMAEVWQHGTAGHWYLPTVALIPSLRDTRHVMDAWWWWIRQSVRSKKIW